jgi:uncharacterized lipoprotein YmbA
MPRLLAVCVMLFLGGVVAGCASPPSRFYTLNATASPGAATSKLSIAIGPVSVPGAVDQPQIVISTGANQVTFDEFSRWASPLQDNISGVVAENLVALLGTPRVTLYPQTLSTDIDYRVQIEVRNFESTPGTSAALDAVWTVRRSKDGKTETGRTSTREPVQDASYAALAAAHSRGVARMSADIAQAVKALDRGSPP